MEPTLRPARRLAKAAAQTQWRSLPPAVQTQALAIMLDTFAVIAGGARHPSLHPVLSRMRGDGGTSTLIGHGERADSHTAALFNGAATTVLQLQDGHRMARGHPMSHVLPAAFALAQEIEATPEDFLSAVVAGYEVCARVGRALGGLQTLLHDAGTFGTIGAAVAAARLLAGSDAEILEQAIEGAAAVTLFPYRDTPVAGATVHHLYIGLGAANGLTAGRAATFGLTALPGTLEDFFGPRAGADFRPRELLWGMGEDDRWSDHELLQGYLKPHPTCAHLNGVNDAILAILSQGPLEGDAIGEVEVAIYAAALPYNNPDPPNDLAARFSIPFAVAIALLYGGLGVDGISDARLRDSRVRSLAARVQVRHDPALDEGYPAGRPTRVVLTLRDGSQREAEIVVPHGDASSPLSADERHRKAWALLEPAYGSRTRAIVQSIETLPQAADLGELGQLLSGEQGTQA